MEMEIHSGVHRLIGPDFHNFRSSTDTCETDLILQSFNLLKGLKISHFPLLICHERQMTDRLKASLQAVQIELIDSSLPSSERSNV